MALRSQLLRKVFNGIQVRNLHELNNKERAGVTKLREVLDDRLKEIKKAKTWKHERVLTSPQQAKVTVQGAKGEYLNFCANNYLGYSNHPEVVEAARESLDKYGAGLSSVRFICGTQTLHKNTERGVNTASQCHSISIIMNGNQKDIVNKLLIEAFQGLRKLFNYLINGSSKQCHKYPLNIYKPKVLNMCRYIIISLLMSPLQG
ncbi:hypothetical protein evm_000648 [Chilo suppressalis]|nr:hypothetical protein evm_000648 [Chilo suppressalis]